MITLIPFDVFARLCSHCVPIPGRFTFVLTRGPAQNPSKDTIVATTTSKAGKWQRVLETLLEPAPRPLLRPGDESAWL